MNASDAPEQETSNPEYIVELLGIEEEEIIKGFESSTKKVSDWLGTHPLLDEIWREYKPDDRPLIVITFSVDEKDEINWLVKKSTTST